LRHPAQLNAVMARWAQTWIAGPTEATVRSALENCKPTLPPSRLVH
jgi:hypothetical protein